MRKEPHLADVVWTDAKIQWSLSIKSLMSLVSEAIERKAIHNLKPERNIMMIGIPNTGEEDWRLASLFVFRWYYLGKKFIASFKEAYLA